MTFHRLFTDDQLIQLAKSPSELAEDALALGDIERMKALLEEMSVAHKPPHVLALHTLARMWGKYRATFGDEKAGAMLESAAAKLVVALADAWKQGEEKSAISDVVALYRNQAGAALSAHETDDEVVVELAPCGSGGMLIKQKWAEREPKWYAPFDDGTPVVCRGCKALQSKFNERCGSQTWTTQIAPDGSGACKMTFRKDAARGTRLFDAPGELVALGETRVSKAQASLTRGDTRIGPLIHDQQREWQPWHDFMMCWLEYSFAAFHAEGGFDLLQQVFLECYESVFYPRYAVFESWSDEERLRRSAWSWHYHMGRFRILEEEHRFVFILDPCGSGARLFRGDVTSPPFKYGGELAPLTQHAHPMSFGRTEFPLYCSHCAATNATQFEGLPLIFVVDGHAQLRPGMPCRQYLYKKGAPRIVEQRLLSQVGFTSVAPALALTSGPPATAS